MLRGRASIRNRYKKPTAAAMKARLRMRSNPGLQGFLSMFLKDVAPVAASLYVSRFVSGKVAANVPGLSSVPAQFQSPVLAVGVFAAGAFLSSKVAPLRKYRSQILLGFGLNVLDKIVSAFAPADVKAMIGLGTFYSPQGEYLQVGATPINDDIALSEYLQVGQYFDSDGSGVYSDLGVEQDLGDWDDRNLGGVSNRSMLASVPGRSMLSAVPVRSFTKEVPGITGGFDDAGVYTGMFEGGF